MAAVRCGGCSGNPSCEAHPFSVPLAILQSGLVLGTVGDALGGAESTRALYLWPPSIVIIQRCK
jgi:hypothetical protein